MSFFEKFNAAPPKASKATYKPASDLTLFRLMKAVAFTPCTTTVGKTTRVNALLNEEEEIFFFMNEEDCTRMGVDGAEFFTSLVALGTAPFVFMARVKNSFRTVVVPFDVSLLSIYQNGGLISKSLIPEGVKDDIDFEKLATNGCIIPE